MYSSTSSALAMPPTPTTGTAAFPGPVVDAVSSTDIDWANAADVGELATPRRGSGIDKIEGVGVSYDEVVRKLEDEGLTKFVASWNELLDSVKGELEAAAK